MPQTLDDLTNEEFDQLIEQYIERSAEWDGALPLDTMLETWAEIERRKQPPSLTCGPNWMPSMPTSTASPATNCQKNPGHLPHRAAEG